MSTPRPASRSGVAPPAAPLCSSGRSGPCSIEQFCLELTRHLVAGSAMHVGRAGIAVTPDASLADLRLDSLEVLALLFWIEEVTDVALAADDLDIDDLRSVGDLHRWYRTLTSTA